MRRRAPSPAPAPTPSCFSSAPGHISSALTPSRQAGSPHWSSLPGEPTQPNATRTLRNPRFIAPGGHLDISSPHHSHIQIQAPQLPAYILLFPTPLKFLSGSCSSPDAPGKTREWPPSNPFFLSHLHPAHQQTLSLLQKRPHPTTVPTWVQLPPVSLLPLLALVCSSYGGPQGSINTRDGP